MAKSQDSNVIHLVTREDNNGQRTPDLTLLQSCRDHLIDSLRAVFTRQVGRANEELLAMMDQPIDQAQRQLCIDALSFLAKRTPAMLQRFRESYLEIFDQTIAQLGSPRASSTAALSGELSLVDEADFELDLTLTKLTTRSAYHCAQSMVALDRRVATLLGLPRLAQEEDPFYPMTIYRALFQALTAMEVVRDLAIFLLQVFERQVAGDLPVIYAEINRQLAESGILPQIPLTEVQTKVGQPDRAPDSGADRVMGAPSATTAGVQTGDLFEQLWQSWQRSTLVPAGSGAALGLLGMPALVGMTPPAGGTATPAISPPLSRDQLIQTLAGLQRWAPDTGSWPELGALGLDPTAVNVIAQLRSTPELRSTSALDSMVMDVVAMLFDAVFKDPDLPDAVRAEIAKLQIPILKVALLDRSFFSDRKHPARRLLDVLAESYLGRDEREMQPLLDKIRSVVKTILEDFDSDIGVLVAQVEQFESFLAEEEAKAKAKSEALLADLARRERQGLAEQRISSEIERRVKRAGVPAQISDFLERGWRPVLKETFIEQGDNSPEWGQALQLMDDLIWSVAPKTNATERERLIAMLPGLIQGLRSGLARLGLERDWDGFFSTLIQSHVAAIRGESAGELPDKGEGASARLPPRPEPLTIPLTQQRNKEPAAAQITPQLELVQSLKPGAWIEFQTERGTRNTLRLSWVSEFKGVFLFTNRQGENAMTLAAASLAEHLRKGSARLLSQNPLTERAVARVIEQMQNRAAGPNAQSQSPDHSAPQNPDA